nr:unnamed protein product [Digitaria exilis]
MGQEEHMVAAAAREILKDEVMRKGIGELRRRRRWRRSGRPPRELRWWWWRRCEGQGKVAATPIQLLLQRGRLCELNN